MSGCLHYVSKFKFHTESQVTTPRRIFSMTGTQEQEVATWRTSEPKIVFGTESRRGRQWIVGLIAIGWIDWWDVGKGEFNSTHSLTSCHSPMWLRFTNPPNGQEWVPKPNVVLGCEDWLPSAVGAAADFKKKTIYPKSIRSDQTQPNPILVTMEDFRHFAN